MASYYVDPSIAGNSGAGTVGDPYGDLQHALDTITRNATTGDQINIKAGTAEILAAALSFATYGAPALGAGLAIVGYTSAENDRGIGEISGAATYSIHSGGTHEGVTYMDMTLGNCGAANVLTLDRFSGVHNCKIYGSSGTGLVASTPFSVSSTWFDDLGIGVSGSTDCNIVDCLFTNGATNIFSSAVTAEADLVRCCFSLTSTSHAFTPGGASETGVVHCSFLTTGTGNAINNVRSIYQQNTIGCLFEGWAIGVDYSGTTESTPGSLANNAFYDCTTDHDSPENLAHFIDNESLGAALFDKTGSISSFADRLTFLNPVDQGNVYNYVGGLAKGAVQPTAAGGGLLRVGMSGGIFG